MQKPALNQLQAMPKVELHRHLEGSLRLETLVDIARQYNMDVPAQSVDALRPFVQMTAADTHTSDRFLSKFNTLRQFYRDEAIIQRIAREVVEDAARDNVHYMELRFTPKALCNITNTPLDEIVPLVCLAANDAAKALNIDVRFLLSMNRHEPVAIGEEVLRAAVDYREHGIVGIDLAGDEANYSCLPFAPLFREAKREGFGITIHAGEWAGGRSVRDAVEAMSADRLGHGVHALEDEGILSVLAERQITLEMCPSSNVLSGVVGSLQAHPLQRFDELGIDTTINTDDPLICNVTLSSECHKLMLALDMSLEAIKQAMLRAARAAFLPKDDQDKLVASLTHALAAF